jgi:hypothetical protein
VPAIFVSHDALAWHDAPPLFPRIRAYVAVDELNQARLARETGLPPGDIPIIQNGVDLSRVKARAPLPARPRRALFFSNYADEREGGALPAVREACRRAGLELEVWGASSGNPVERPEERLGEFDLVFGKARCALEAMASGAAVVLCDFAGSGPLVTAGEFARLRRQNFGRAVLTGPLDAGRLLTEIGRYDAADAARVSALCRAGAGLEDTLDQLLALYERMIRVPAESGSEAQSAELRSAAAYLRRWGPLETAGEEVGSLRAVISDVHAALDEIEQSRSWRFITRLRRMLGLR